MNYPIALSPLPVYVRSISATVQCGFPSPAEDHQQERLDLNSLIINQADATYFMRVRGSSMKNAGIDDGDYIVIDRSLEPKHGNIVLAVVDGEFTVKRLSKRAEQVSLIAENPSYPNIDLKDGQELLIWGVVSWTVKNNLHA